MRIQTSARGTAFAPCTAAAAAAAVTAPPDAFVSWRFPAMPVHAHMARGWLDALMDHRGLERDAAYNASVVFSELVTNAVVHGTGPVSVRVRVEPGVVECEITDEAADLPVVYEAEEDDENHRGLSLVEVLATNWEVRRRPAGGKTVAFTVRG